ncbi:MAG: ABC transporter permease, partial [Acidimicrobiales bacterium]
MIWVQLALSGVAVGSIYALAGMGVVLTYKATGVFNFAHGAIAVLAAYVYWQLAGETSDGGWGWPVGLAALVVVFVLGPLLGALLEVVVFRPLHRSGASTTEKLVATVGAFVLVIGVVVAVWTFEVRQVPSLFGTRPLQIASDLVIGIDQLMTVVVAAAVCVGIWALFRFTPLGTEIRAVVDRRELAELAAVNADRVSALAWMMGTTLSALTGVLLAAQSVTLNPYGLTLLVVETFSIAVVARLTSLPVAVGAGVLLLGVGGSLLADPRVSLLGGQGFLGETFDDIKPNLSVVLLFGALLLYRRLDAPDDERPVVAARPAGSPRQTVGLAATSALVLVALPFVLDLSGFAYAHRMLAMIVIFASIVAVTGFAGQLTLGQTGFAGLGGFVTARLVNTFDLPVVVAMVGGGLVAMLAGLLVGYPAVRRRGLFLGLTTLAVALLLSRFVFENDRFAGGSVGLQLDRPSLFGWDLSGDRAFYFFELAVMGLALLLTRNLRTGRLGRALAAMRDSEVGARSVGL